MLKLQTLATARRARRLLLLCTLGLALGACTGSNVFEPCDPDGDTPHTPCPQEQTA